METKKDGSPLESRVVKIDGVAAQVKTGDMVFAEANVLHGVRNTGTTRMTFYFVKMMGKSA